MHSGFVRESLNCFDFQIADSDRGQERVDYAHSKSVPNLKDGGPGRDQRRPGRSLLRTLHLGLFRHF